MSKHRHLKNYNLINIDTTVYNEVDWTYEIRKSTKATAEISPFSCKSCNNLIYYHKTLEKYYCETCHKFVVKDIVSDLIDMV